MKRKWIILIWWYLVTYNSSGEIVKDALQNGSVIGEYQRQSDCDDQLTLYYVRNPRSFAQCEGSRMRLDYEGQKYQLKLEKLRREVEVLRRNRACPLN